MELTLLSPVTAKNPAVSLMLDLFFDDHYFEIPEVELAR